MHRRSPLHLETRRRPGFWVRLAAVTLLPAGLALAGGWADGAGSPPAEPPDPPPEVKGDLAEGVAQDQADLRRTREHLYGFALSAAQHDQVETWRVKDSDWWLDGGRNLDARNSLEELKDLLQSTDSRALQDSLDLDPRFFGVRVEQKVYVVDGGDSEEVGHEPVTETALRMTLDARLRPDLFSFHEAVFDFSTGVAEQVAPLGAAGRQAFVLDVLGLEVSAAEGSGGAKSAATLHVDDYFGPTVALVDGLGVSLSERLEAWYDDQHAIYLAQDGQGYDVSVQRWIDGQARRLGTELVHDAVEDYLGQLEPEIREALVSYLSTKFLPARITVLEGQTAEREAYWVLKMKALYELL